FYTSNHSKTDYNCPLKPSEIWDGSHYKNRPPNQPFFSVFNHEVTHESCLFPTKEIPTVDPAKISVPPYQPDTPEIRADWARYYSHIAQLDSQIAAKLQELATAGLAEDTIIFYYSDNGGVLPRSKRFLHESGTHVPLIVYYPPKWQHLAPAPPGSRIKDPVHFIDFAPTVLSLLGIPIPAYFQGHPFAGPAKSPPQPFVFCMRDRMDESFDTIRSVADSRYLYIHNYRPDRPYVPFLHYMFQARGYQSWARLAQANQLTPATAMFWGEKPPEELYDSLTDPHNIHNLATDPAQLENLQRFRQALEERVIANCDNGFLPEGSPLEGFANSHAPNAYPIQRVFALANLASQRLPANLPTFIQSLSDPSEPIRWWAAQGCAILGPLATPAKSALLSALHDPSPAVQIAAAESLARLGLLEPSLPILALWATQSAHHQRRKLPLQNPLPRRRSPRKESHPARLPHPHSHSLIPHFPLPFSTLHPHPPPPNFTSLSPLHLILNAFPAPPLAPTPPRPQSLHCPRRPLRRLPPRLLWLLFPLRLLRHRRRPLLLLRWPHR
ncbi:MAG: sulfatase-like hydrolase/transferase, partial [Verrucomicrobiota bacterium]